MGEGAEGEKGGGMVGLTIGVGKLTVNWLPIACRPPPTVVDSVIGIKIYIDSRLNQLISINVFLSVNQIN